jgi:hypothetical protein
MKGSTKMKLPLIILLTALLLTACGIQTQPQPESSYPECENSGLVKRQVTVNEDPSFTGYVLVREFVHNYVYGEQKIAQTHDTTTFNQDTWNFNTYVFPSHTLTFTYNTDLKASVYCIYKVRSSAM